MKGYLNRLVTRGLGDTARAGVLPLVRSSSPIAQEDQRLGLSGFDGFQSMSAPPIEGTPEATIAPAGDVPSYTPSRIISAQDVGGGTIQKEAARPGDAGAVATPGFTGGRPVFGREPAGETASDIRFSRQWRAPTVLPDEELTSPQTQLTGVQQALQSNSVGRENAGIADVPVGEPVTPASPFFAETETPGTPRRRSADSAPQLLEPSPRPIRSAQQRESIFSDAAESADTAEQGPRVVIGRINVEVVAPATAPKASAPSRPGPLTAASVSVIGPLTRGVRSSLRLSLKHR